MEARDGPTFPARSISRRESRKHSSPPLVPAAIAIFVVAMVVALILRGRSARGVCQYESTYRRVTCKAKQLTSIPRDVSDGALALIMGTKLDKAENYFTTLQRSNFTRFRQLQELKLVKCGIEEIQSETFGDLTSLRRLDLRFNRIQYLSQETFKGLTNLEYIYLSSNPIQELGDFLFRGIRLEEVVLANNPALTQISQKAFAGAIIKTLVLNRCGLHGLQTETLTHVAGSLQELHITNNLQTLDLPDDVFKGLKLETLNLANNGLTQTDFLEQVLALEVNLDDNPLEGLNDFEDDDAPMLSQMKRLSLSNTRITHISQDNVGLLTGLEVLDLEANDITSFNVTALQPLKKLVILDLSNNDLSEITITPGLTTGEDMQPLPSLKGLYLDRNDLETLPSDLEPLISGLDNLTLSDNPLHCNCELRWFTKWLENHRLILQDIDAVQCQTPESQNLTQVSEYGFKCRPPTILNATFDADGVNVVCTAEGDPAPTVIWVSPSGERKTERPSLYDKTELQTKASLTLTKDGNYTCTAVNIQGEDSVMVDTKKIPTSGLKFVVQSQEIDILETPQGLCFTVCLVAILGYLLRYY